MNIVILNGNPDTTDFSFERYLDLYRVKLHKAGHYVRCFLLRDMEINDFRTHDERVGPIKRECNKDDFRYISNALQETDLLVTASPLEKGSITVLAKIVNDRLARVLNPHENMLAAAGMGRIYTSRNIPLIGLILQAEPDTRERDLLLNRLMGERMAANMHTVLSFCTSMESDITETLYKTFQSIEYHGHVEQISQELIGGSVRLE
jgi:hypothetical protein